MINPLLFDYKKREVWRVQEHNLWSFRQNGDMRNGLLLNFGNMVSGYSFTMFAGTEFAKTFQNSEAAYIAGVYNNGSDLHLEAQKQCLISANGYLLKGILRKQRNNFTASINIPLWEKINVEWMKICQMYKVETNENYREMLCRLPSWENGQQGALIVEDSTGVGTDRIRYDETGNEIFHTSMFWGMKSVDRRKMQKASDLEIEDKWLGKKKYLATKQMEERYVLDNKHNFEFWGCNCQGKIVTLAKYCLDNRLNMADSIDWSVFEGMNFYWFGKKLMLYKTSKI